MFSSNIGVICLLWCFLCILTTVKQFKIGAYSVKAVLMLISGKIMFSFDPQLCVFFFRVSIYRRDKSIVVEPKLFVSAPAPTFKKFRL
jgi:hypothetical protein